MTEKEQRKRLLKLLLLYVEELACGSIDEELEKTYNMSPYDLIEKAIRFARDTNAMREIMFAQIDETPHQEETH